MSPARADPSSTSRDVVVVGASAGGVEALQKLVELLPEDFPAAVLVVLHVPAQGSVLPYILARSGRLPATHAVDGQEIVPGRIAVAPPDHHLLVDDHRVRVTRGPRENGHRPAVDPLFRTAAARFGNRTIGIVLSGTLDDGSAGLALLKRAGGVTVVQDPEEALYPGMPTAAIAAVDPAYVLPVAEIARLLDELVRAPRPPEAESEVEEEAMHEEDVNALEPQEITSLNEAAGKRSRFTCPECSGLLWEIREGELVKLRCRVGHAYTEQGFLAEHGKTLEAALWTAATALEEKADFCRRVASRFEAGGQEITARRYRDQADNALAQGELVRRAIENLLAPPLDEEQAAS